MASDRPLRRRIWKLAATLAYGRRRAHAYDWAPSLRIEPAPYGPERTILFRDRPSGTLLPPSALSDLAGSDITIVGSGPSVRDADLGALANCSTLLLNGAIALVPERVPRPLAFAVEDERFVYRHFQTFIAGLDRSILCLLSVAVIRAILEHDPDWLLERSVILIDNLLKPYGENRRDLSGVSRMPAMTVDMPSRSGVSLDPALGVFQGGSVAVSALQFTLFCRPRIVGFIGIDIANAAQPRFYEAPGERVFSGVSEAEGRILAHIRLAKTVGEARGSTFVNYARTSALQKIGIAFSDRLTASR
ncbi:glycosyl transferase [Rhizobium sp. DKSPLA3]|uniref:Glycosyl transferase n=1 Tax=Rhizobium quercicola TaxID=2901226 RepID=A0A9X1T3H6_9HYPH|nr:glycosyl transferase [Rhizobium quercicola]MCD7111865.1 glycosyl transferase [Rhizobium quercicola]